MELINTRPLPMPDGTLPPVLPEIAAPVDHGGPPTNDVHPDQTLTPTSTPLDPGAPSTGPPPDQGEPPTDAQTNDYWYELIDQHVAGQFLGVKGRTMADWRYREIGPRWFSISATCKRYRRIDLAAFAQEKTQAPAGEVVA